ncbi:MAG: chemotaxis protein CheW [Thiotrichales bacterium]
MNAAVATDLESKAPSSAQGSQYLTFLLAGEEYGVNILNVQEIKGWMPTTQIPNTPRHVLGVINLRGAVVPIVDLRKRFAFEHVEYGPTTVVIFVKIDGQRKTIGMVVDAVSEVYNIPETTIEPPPEMGAKLNIEFINGLATVENKMVILIDVQKLVEANM